MSATLRSCRIYLLVLLGVLAVRPPPVLPQPAFGHGEASLELLWFQTEAAYLSFIILSGELNAPALISIQVCGKGEACRVSLLRSTGTGCHLLWGKRQGWRSGLVVKMLTPHIEVLGFDPQRAPSQLPFSACLGSQQVVLVAQVLGSLAGSQRTPGSAVALDLPSAEQI